ncbi:ATP-binding cassette domain-containing protein [Spiroplasma tabanidicola]|uniref:ABC transporter ATP-binding protein n=1 Tax=Spiroplasma tabanidicola TaxID=324079 RepID=A0A6I6C624_9MOLU|nr:ATP-binding cassette domain-containing protein [Spiroplasma tabanidicola]QGS51600.1 ABC transporter ATP-binding protein [Spiroplasma tabanidicola]
MEKSLQKNEKEKVINSHQILNLNNNQSGIQVNKLEKKFKSGYGIEDINFIVKPGKVFGYLGPNGAGKSTTIRSLMGFIKPDKGSSLIETKGVEELTTYDSWKDKDDTQKLIGYVPGEIAFPENMNGVNLLKMIFKLRNMTDWEQVKKYIYYWEFDPNMKIKKMSKGMKQKLALVIAWMHNPDIIILDEPTTGLDPLMQEKFVSLVKKSKAEGKAIIMSSHIFSEIEKTCDTVAIIKKGKIVSLIDVKDIHYNDEKTYEVKFQNKVDNILKESKLWKVDLIDEKTAMVVVENKNINQFLEVVTSLKAEFLKEHPLDLEQYFMKYYENEISTVVKDNIEKFDNNIKPTAKHKAKLEFIKRSYRKMSTLWLFLTILPIAMLSILFITMYTKGTFDLDPALNGKSLVETQMKIKATLNQVMNMMFFGNLGFLLPVVFIIVTSGSIVSGEVEKGTMVNMLTTSLTRKSVIITKLTSFISLIGLGTLLQYIVSIIFIQAFKIQEYIDLSTFAVKFLGLFLLLFLIGSIGFMSSCYFNRSVYALSLVGVIVIVSWVLTIAAKADESLKPLKYISINTLFDYEGAKASDLSTFLGQYLFMALAGTGLFVGSYFVFTKKDLPL